jgi:hypothetical protein
MLTCTSANLPVLGATATAPRAFEYLLHRMEPRTVDRRGVPTSIGELKGASVHGSDA